MSILVFAKLRKKIKVLTIQNTLPFISTQDLNSIVKIHTKTLLTSAKEELKISTLKGDGVRTDT